MLVNPGLRNGTSPSTPTVTSEGLVGIYHTAKVGCVHLAKPKASTKIEILKAG